ncbi:rhomboid family protein [Mucilaginibacter auburnensis]|uniref:Membrane associated rhomboid family serine protease n=1 Tax=Mucilaginibacter auburnensis TaxID=1457233 RepID=A0A2H9VT11_9SPHI|nr:rhomboid family intramembrane serine protease [Mucilaginibacter auburnensis]PJJ83944.1 membrane associated rhomboid family serine protease [Mucilaginibacter auburnensis]
MSFLENTRLRTTKPDSKLFLLIGVNVVVFLLAITPAKQIIASYFAVPGGFSALAIRPWTPITYMFTHLNFFHLLYNMLWLYWMGQIFEEFLGYKRTVGLYLMGGLTGAIFYILLFTLLPSFTGRIMVGASASVMAIIVAAATLVPNYKISVIILGELSIKWVAILFIVLSFLGLKGANAGGEIAHLGGALIGFIYIKQLQRGNDWIESLSNIFKPKRKLKVVSTNNNRSVSTKPRQDEVDEILDKISRTGYDSLNKHEKEVLFRASKHEEN